MISEIEIQRKLNIQNSSLQLPKTSSIINDQKGCQISGKAPYLVKKETAKLEAYAYFLLNSVVILYILGIQLYFSQPKQNSFVKNLFQFKSSQMQIYYFLYSLLIFTKCLLLLTVAMEIIIKAEIFGVSWVTKQVVEYAPIFISFDLAFSALMVAMDWRQNIASFVLSAVFCILQAVYIQNYTFRKDCLYASSSYDFILFRSIILLIYFGNTLFFVLKLENGFYLYVCFIGLLHSIWYLKNGHSLFIHRETQMMFFILNSLFFTVYTAFAEKLLIGTPPFSMNQISKIIIVFITFIVALYIRSLRGISQLCSKDSTPKAVDILVRKSLQTESNDTDISSELIGTLQMHQLTGCDQCTALKQKDFVYDPFLKAEIKAENFFVQKQTGLLYFVKELYQRQIDKEERDTAVQDHINYCEFLCNEHSDFYLALKLLSQIRLRPLNLIQNIKVSTLEQYIEAESQKLNQTLYDGTLQIEHIIEAEDCFALIESGIMQYIAHNLAVWKTLGGSQKMKHFELKTALKWDFATFNSIETQWKKVAKFMDINKAWRAIYTHYQMLIRNERLKQKDFDQLGNSKENETLFSRVLYFDENDKQEKLIDPAIMFDKDTGCISVFQEGGQLIISRCNNRFSRITGFTEEEIVGCKIQTLMAADLASIHDQKFRLWLHDGYISNELAYKIRFTSVLRKDAEQLSAVKYFKAHYHQESGLEFFCLFKFNIKQDLNELIKTQNGSFLHADTKQLVNCQTFTENYSDIKNENHRAEIRQSIFSKEDFLQPCQEFKQVKYFGYLSRIFVIVIISSIIILSLVIQVDSASLNGYASQFMTIMIMYRSPVNLLTSYMKSVLNFSGAGGIKVNVGLVTNLLLTTSSSQAIKKTLFDPSLNPKAYYYPYYKYPFLANQSLSGIDLYNTIIASVTSLSTNISLSLPLNRTSREFQRFNSYLKPSYDTMMNTTKFKIHETFSNILTQSLTLQYSFIIGQIIFFIIFLILLFFLIYTFTNKMENILDILLNFTPSQIKDIRRYWKKVEKNFDTLFKRLPGSKKYSNKLTPIEVNAITKTEQSQNQPEFSANKRSNSMADDQKRKAYKLKLQILTIIGLTIVLGMSVLTQGLMINQFYKLQQFQSDGFYYLKYFPCGPIVALGCIERYYSTIYPSDLTYNPKRYEDSLYAVTNFGYNYSYIANTDASSLYFTKQKNYFFGSPCDYNPSVQTKNGMPAGGSCFTTCNGTLKQGLSSFMRYASVFGTQCITGQVNMTATQVNDFTMGSLIYAYYVFDTMDTWTSEFTQKAQSVQVSNLNSCLIVMGVAIIVHIVISQYMIYRKLKDEYSFVKRIYMNMIPEDILIKEKVLRQKFIIEGIIQP